MHGVAGFVAGLRRLTHCLFRAWDGFLDKLSRIRFGRFMRHSK